MDVDLAQMPQKKTPRGKEDVLGLYRLAAKLGFSQNEIIELRQTYGAAFALDHSHVERGGRKGKSPK